MLLGGLKNGRQYFNRDAIGVHSTILLLSVAGLLIPTLFEVLREVQRGETLRLDVSDPALDLLSLGFAALLIVVYILSLVFSIPNKDVPPAPEENEQVAKAATADSSDEGEKKEKSWSVPVSVGLLIASSLALIFLSDVLVGGSSKW